MDRSRWSMFFSLAPVALLCFAAGGFLGRSLAYERWEQRCVRLGLAEYVIINPQTGMVIWVWKDRRLTLQEEHENGK